MNAVLEAAREIQEFIAARHWKFCFIGGLAVQKWSEPRVTDDVDITLLTGFGSEEAFLDELLGWLEPRRPDAREFALQRRVLLVRTPSGVSVDIALAAFSLSFSKLAKRFGNVAAGLKLRFLPGDLPRSAVVLREGVRLTEVCGCVGRRA